MSNLTCKCGNKFEDKAALSSHEKYCEESEKPKPEKKHECQCGETFVDSGGFKLHKRNCPVVQGYFEDPTHCKECEKILKYSRRDKSFCSQSCSASYNNRGRTLTKNQKNKISKSVSNTLEKKYSKRCIIRFETCVQCENTFITSSDKHGFGYYRKTCSESCLSKLRSEIGRKSAKTQGNKRRSKNEIYFAELCKEKFKNVLTNERIFNGWDADVVLKDYKIAILWNGIWHYEKITEQHSVEQVQNRDKVKKKEIKNKGYKPYVIKDMGGHNPDFVEEKFDQLLLHLNLV